MSIPTRTLAAALGVALLLAGCSSNRSAAPAVAGKVVHKKGDVGKLAGGHVRLKSETDPSLAVSGSIEDDGSFTLGAYSAGKALTEIPAGQYKVRVDPPKDDDGNPKRGLIQPRYQDFNKSGLKVTIPPPGELVIEVD
ncbi:MAG TPA: hypothetical protein VGF55_00495 [Gemmataceae bacterium]|jgi:hypothetical protein